MENIEQHIFKFNKKEKLCRTKSVDELFAKGQSFIAYPLRIVYLIEQEDEIKKRLPNVLVSVSKKKFRRAVKRNRVKRLIREAYRLNNASLKCLLIENSIKINIAFLFLKDELPSYDEIEKGILKAIRLMQEKIDELDNSNI